MAATTREGGDHTASSTQAALTSRQQDPAAEFTRREFDDSNLNTTGTQQDRQMLSQMSQSLLEAALNDALEAHPHRELHQTAEETVGEALVAAGAGEL